jgi:uncharacterized protein
MLNLLIKDKNMKNAIILHAMGNSPADFWYPWLKSQLEQKGYEVWVPQLPDTASPRIDTWVPYIFEHGKFTPETILIGHSAGAAVSLSVLEALPTKISQAILIAGFCFYPGGDPIVKPAYNWEKINANTGEVFFINSDNDPYGHDDIDGRMMLEYLSKDGGIQIIMKGQGHMGTEEFNQPYKEFPLLLRLIK